MEDLAHNEDVPKAIRDKLEWCVNLFTRRASEFYDSVLIAIVTVPSGSSDPYRVIRASGLPQANLKLAALYANGELPDGAWYCGPSGVLPAAVVFGNVPEDLARMPAEWTDTIANALTAEVDGLLRVLVDTPPPLASGVLVLCTAGGTSAGATKVLAMSAGNSVACAGALAYWMNEVL